MRNRLSYSHCQEYWTDQYLNHMVLTSCCNFTLDLYLQAIYNWEELERCLWISKIILGWVGTTSPPCQFVCFRRRSPQPRWNFQCRHPCPWSLRKAYSATCKPKEWFINWQDLLLWSQDWLTSRRLGFHSGAGLSCSREQRVWYSFYFQCI